MYTRNNNNKKQKTEIFIHQKAQWKSKQENCKWKKILAIHEEFL